MKMQSYQQDVKSPFAGWRKSHNIIQAHETGLNTRDPTAPERRPEREAHITRALADCVSQGSFATNEALPPFRLIA